MSSNPRIFDDPSKIRGHMAAEISNALLCEAKAAMESSAIPQKRKRTRRKKSVTSRREKRQRAQSPALASVVSRSPVCEEVPELTACLETRLQELRATLTSVEYPVATEKTLWAQRQAFADVDTEFLCGSCDIEAHKKNVFHNREAIFHGYLEPIPPTKAVVLDDNGQPHFCEQGRYDVCLPRKVCPSCFAEWTPGVKDLLNYRYWPSTSSCQTLSRFDIFEAFAHMKASAPSMSRHAFLKLLEHPSVQAGRPGNICADTFQRSFFEYCFCKHTEEVMCDVNSFYCPACHPDKHYRFRKSRGTEEPSLYAGLFLAQDEEANDSGMCGVSRFKASKETSKKSSSKLDEEGIQVAVCSRNRVELRIFGPFVLNLSFDFKFCLLISLSRMAHNRKPQELSPLASPIKKKSKPPTSIDMVDKMANTVAHFEDILKTELTVMRNEFASHMSVVQSLCSKLDLLTGEMREQKKVVADHDRRVTALEQQVVDLQDRSRRSNLRLIGLPEGAEKDDPVGFFEKVASDVAAVSGGQRD
ncbi:hypothetical protein QQF64_036429 [Cirrhinus molitorella]|uniref:CxC3 like cysteine cluster domain-containing protein n=1 Tax=Cirrhinus molitorella TaxID=172907 RepID=A0ABR3NIJ5_9TELE